MFNSSTVICVRCLDIYNVSAQRVFTIHKWHHLLISLRQRSIRQFADNNWATCKGMLTTIEVCQQDAYSLLQYFSFEFYQRFN